MERIFKYNRYVYMVVHIFIGLDIFNRTKDNINNFLVFMGLFLLVVLNNYLRMKYFYRDGNKFFLSMLIYMIISSILIFNINGYVDILNFMIIYELILFTDGNRSKIFIILTITNTFFIIIFRNLSLAEILSLQFWRNNLIDLFMVIIYLFFYSVSLLGYKALRKEKWKVEKLNKELELSYNKLMEQSEEIEKLTIAKERNRVAGEIHDTLGHSLVALNMNLDVAEKIIDNNLDKTRELLNKAKTLSKESMNSLRKAVYALKEENSIRLRERLKGIIDNIESAGAVEINLNIDEEIENLHLKHKDIIYNSIKEGITNSIKHGKADRIDIDIKINENRVNIIIGDNGLGCKRLVKGNGLLGIENRINEINGTVDYDSGENKGFEIEIEFLI